jgi:hypothetical protein
MSKIKRYVKQYLKKNLTEHKFFMIENDVCILLKWNSVDKVRVRQIISDLHNYFNCIAYITTSPSEFKENVIGVATYHYVFDKVTKKQLEKIKERL